jgi:hypothetical protein
LLERRLTQYWQSYEQKWVSSIFSNDMHGPSGVKLSQMPAPVLAPTPSVPREQSLGAPLLVQDASYFAASAHTSSF